MKRLFSIFIKCTLIFSMDAHASLRLSDLNPTLLWYGKNREQLQKMIDQYGKKSRFYNPAAKPVAAFDCDNTIIKNDIGEATLFWMVKHGKVKRPSDWKKMNRWLTDDAIRFLQARCPLRSTYLPTQTNAECADILLSIYREEPLPNGKFPWLASDSLDRILPSYAFYAGLFSGYTPEEMKQFTRYALSFNLKNRIGAMQKIGTKEYPAYIRVYEQMHDLIKTLQHNGFDVWIVSASLQSSVEVMAEKFGVDSHHVIGVRQVLDSNGRLMDAFQGCGPYPDGTKDIWTYRIGKRCWLNKVVFKEKNRQKMVGSRSPLIFAAGDSDTDFFFLKDASVLRLVINRNKKELMCHAYNNVDGKWIVNPMFIQPNPKRADLYSCRQYHLQDRFDTIYE